MKNSKILGIIFIGCAVNQLHSNPTSAVTRGIADMAADTAARGLATELGEISQQAAKVAGKQSFVYRPRPNLNIDVLPRISQPHIELQTQSPIKSSGSPSPQTPPSPSPTAAPIEDTGGRSIFHPEPVPAPSKGFGSRSIFAKPAPAEATPTPKPTAPAKAPFGQATHTAAQENPLQAHFEATGTPEARERFRSEVSAQLKPKPHVDWPPGFHPEPRPATQAPRSAQPTTHNRPITQPTAQHRQAITPGS